MNREMVFYNQRMIDKTLNKEEMKALNTRSLLYPLEPEPDQDPHYPTNNVKTPILTPNLLLFPFTTATSTPRSPSLPTLHSGHDIIDAKQHARRLDGGLDGLGLHLEGVPHAQFAHVRDGSLHAVHAQEPSLALRLAVLRLRLSRRPRPHA